MSRKKDLLGFKLPSGGGAQWKSKQILYDSQQGGEGSELIQHIRIDPELGALDRGS